MRLEWCRQTLQSLGMLPVWLILLLVLSAGAAVGKSAVLLVQRATSELGQRLPPVRPQVVSDHPAGSALSRPDWLLPCCPLHLAKWKTTLRASGVGQKLRLQRAITVQAVTYAVAETTRLFTVHLGHR